MHVDEDRRALTRGQRRERARAERHAAERAQAAAATKRTRLRLLAGVLAIVLTGIVIVLIAAPRGAAPKPVAPQSAAARAATSEISSLLAGIPQSSNVLGRPGAPVTLEYFADLQCPVCQAFTVGALPSIVHRWVRGGQLKIEYRSLETATREPEVFEAEQVAALAAGKQGKMWNFLETFYNEQQEENSGYVTERFLAGIAQQVPGLDLARWRSDRGDPALPERLAVDAQTANSEALNGTPAFLIVRPGRAASRLEPSSFTEPKSFNEAIAASIHG
jgi:protein-disulfide isomerase